MGNCCSGEVAAGRQAIAGGYGNVENFLNSRSAFLPSSQIELSLSASSLCDNDMSRKSDPMAVVYVKRRDGILEEIGRTEIIRSSVDPVWITKVNITYYFEVVQPMVFHLYDVDSQFHDVPLLKLADQQLLGETSCSLSEIITTSTGSLTLNLVPREASGIHFQKLGSLTLHAEESFGSKIMTEIMFRCSGLENKDIFSKIDPFLVISRTAESGTLIPLCKTEVRKDDLNPVWKPIVLSLQQIGTKDNPLYIECFNFNRNGKHDLIGKVVKSMTDLEKIHLGQNGDYLMFPTAASPNSFDKVLKSQIFVEKISENRKQTFLDYIASGYVLNFMVAVDFTASNGNPRLPDSLHYIDPSGRPNAYQKAILEVGEVVQFYNNDKHFPAWGFGGRPIDGPVSHCFNLNGSTNHSEVDGIRGVMSAYISALYNVSLAGPTLFGPLINTAASMASNSLASNHRKYFVLLIVTDGVITDLQETIDALIRASDLPLSILIIGVGGADFKEMEILDADKGGRLESSSGQVPSRDIVQFVPMRDVGSSGISAVQSLLAELPGQFLSFMQSRHFQPVN